MLHFPNSRGCACCSGPGSETETVSQLASLPARVVVSPYTVHFDTAWIIDCSSTIITTCIGRDLP